MFYDVLYYSYQFNSKSDEIWDSKRIEHEFYRHECDVECSETFDSREEAMQSVEEYMANRMLAPYIERTNNGYVVRGEIIEVVERINEEEIGASCVYVKGMEDEGAE